jgi:hypothetical protein
MCGEPKALCCALNVPRTGGGRGWIKNEEIFSGETLAIQLTPKTILCKKLDNSTKLVRPSVERW